MKSLVKKMFVPVVGLIALSWFLIRVIPKPNRAAYPCMRAAAPLASSFVLYLLGGFSSLLIFRKSQQFLFEKRYTLFVATLLSSIIVGMFSFVNTDNNIYAYTNNILEGANNPIGAGVGVNPGRVVWIHNEDATDETCINGFGDYCRESSNTNQVVVSKMVSDAIQMLTGTGTDYDAWDVIFRNFNQNHDKGDVGYQSGEKFVIKLNLNTGGAVNLVDTSPEVTYAILDQLINVVGVEQADIRIGDPGRHVDDYIWDKCQSVFPDVKYWGVGNGRTSIVQSTEKVVFASNGATDDWLPQSYLDASYMINIPVLKKHHRAGISLSSKNHFGSFTLFHDYDAGHWHSSLPAPLGKGRTTNGDYGAYRCFVDIMGHKDLGGKTLLYLVDGLWSSTNYAHPPIKWRMTPFNNDWPSSIFLAQDPVAIESVCFDFLFNEFDANHPTEGVNDSRDQTGPFPHYPGVDDFLHQAADSSNWPDDVQYDPENDGTLLPASMGAHEHWNNATDKQYSRNLGLDYGIELVTNSSVSGLANEPEIESDFRLYQNYPNPFNPTTTIKYNIAATSHVYCLIFNSLGQRIRTIVDKEQLAGNYSAVWNGDLDNGRMARSGVYFCELIVKMGNKKYKRTNKMVLSK